MIRKIRGIIAMIIVSSIFFWCFMGYVDNRVPVIPKEEIEKDEEVEVSRADVVIWYTDSSLEDYLENVAESYFKKNNVSVDAIYVSSVDYIETINDMNLKGTGAPDIFLCGSEMLEKIYLAGLYTENTDTETYNNKNYPETAINSVTYQEKMLGYPVCYNTSFLIYNNEYVTKAPATFDEIINFANNFTGTEESSIQNILRWNVSELLYNYSFVGAYLDLGGNSGYDSKKVELSNSYAKAALKYYQNLNTVFSIDIDKITTEQIIDEFTKEKNVFAIIDANNLKKIEDSDVNYSVTKVPDLTANLKTKTLSETDIAIINPYAKDMKKAENVVKYLSFDYADKMYEVSGLMCCKILDKYENENIEAVAKTYAESASLPKFRVTGDYWLNLRNMLNDVWTGADPEEALDSLQSTMKEKMSIYK